MPCLIRAEKLETLQHRPYLGACISDAERAYCTQEPAEESNTGPSCAFAKIQ